MMKVLDWISDNPVIVGNIVKAALAVLIMAGLPIPAGIDVAITGVIVAVVTLIERALVTPNGRVDAGYVPPVE